MGSAEAALRLEPTEPKPDEIAAARRMDYVTNSSWSSFSDYENKYGFWNPDAEQGYDELQARVAELAQSEVAAASGRTALRLVAAN